MLDEGFWDDYRRSGPYGRKKEADRPSYFWDEIIEEVTRHAAGGTLRTGNDHPLAEHEWGLRMLAAESRLHRRGLGKALLQLRARVDGEDFHARTVPNAQPGFAYVFVTLRQHGCAYEEYRERRRAILLAHAKITKLRQPDLRRLVGIGMGTEADSDGSVDLVAIDFDGWTTDDYAEAEHLREKLGLCRDERGLTTVVMHEDDYPAPPPSRADDHRPPRQRQAHADRKAKRKAQRGSRRRNRRR